ncbi:MAG: response regulator transcription factor [Herpetosiphonaceae bacterium]|nr:response regulator transcription factor [Herpetosiphonaceae bacterium]
MPAPQILVVDDEPQIRRFIEAGLSAHGYTILTAPNGLKALDLIVTAEPDLVVLDLAMPLLDGLGVIARVREWSSVPIIVLSVRDDDRGKVEALDLGADDYLTKPFSMNELLARIRVALRHAGQRNAPAQAVLRAGGLEMDVPRHIVTVDGTEVHLTPTEFDLLRMLLSNADRVITQRQLLTEVWGAGYEDDIQTLRIFVAQLRRKLKENTAQPHYIMTEPGVGYRLRTEPI